MRILFDHGTPAPLIPFLARHNVTKARDAGWDRLTNGDLLNAAESAGFEVLVTTDKNMRYQQNTTQLPMAVIVMLARDNTYPTLNLLTPALLEKIAVIGKGEVAEIGMRP